MKWAGGARRFGASSHGGASPPLNARNQVGDMRGMRVLLLHNAYRRHGGEDGQVEREVVALRAAGAKVLLHEVRSAEVSVARALLRGWLLGLASRAEARSIRGLIARFRPDAIHIHNTFPFLTPSAIAVAASSGRVAVVTLHNYRAFCANGLCIRDGIECTRCATSRAPHGVIHRCYRDSAVASALVWLVGHRLRRVLRKKGVTVVAPSDAAARLLESSIRSLRGVAVLPNIVVGRQEGELSGERTGVAFIGRLSPEKGAADLVAAWARVCASVPGELRIVGEGPERMALEVAARESGCDRVRFLGFCDESARDAVLSRSALCVVPSRFPETFGLVVAEAAVNGCPCLVTNVGALPETLGGKRCGVIVPSDDPEALERGIIEAIVDHGQTKTRATQARLHVLQEYSAERFVHSLLNLIEDS